MRGTIYLDETTGRWVGQIDAGRTDTGKRRRLKVTGATRREVEHRLAKAREVRSDAVAAITPHSPHEVRPSGPVVYLVECPDLGRVKIGITADLPRRMKELAAS